MEEIIKKLASIMCWTQGPGETLEQVFTRECNWLDAIPHPDIVEVVYQGGLDRWALHQMDVDSEDELYERMMDICNKAVVEACLRDKKRRDSFPPILNFHTYVNNLQKNGKLARECSAIASRTWNGELARKKLDTRCESMFKGKPSDDDFNSASSRMKEIWNLSDSDIDALRYFVCQCRNADHNPSLNKALYLFGEKKQTGKSTFARAFATVLNADKFNNFGKYESSYSAEMGFGTHDLPLACIYNCVILDEAMPKDSRKSYGTLKSVFSSMSFTYNPKFQQPITIAARRNYILTSNNPIDEFVQDRFERRFYAIEFKSKPGQMSFTEIYKLVKQFCVNCYPRIPYQEWYDSFKMVSGVAEKDKDEVLQELFSSESVAFFQSRSTCTVKKIANFLFKNEPTREQKKAVETAMCELADDCRYPSNQYMFDSRKIAVRIAASQGIDIDADTDEAF